MTTPLLDPACSWLWQEPPIPAWGTAARADVVVALEQNGPWGRVAATQSRLDPDLGARLDAHVKALNGRFLLIRRPGRHSETSGPEAPGSHTHPLDAPTRRCYLARTGPGGWLVRADLSDPAVLLEVTTQTLLDAPAVCAAVAGTLSPDPLLLVCTNGRRDMCCARRGRLVANALPHPGEAVWETSHIGGHRFAPTGVLLPWGRMLARLDADLAQQVVAEAGLHRLPLAVLGSLHDRGGMHLHPAKQAAEAWLRVQESRRDLDDDLADAAQRVTVAVQSGPSLPESCGATPTPTQVFQPDWLDETRGMP